MSGRPGPDRVGGGGPLVRLDELGTRGRACAQAELDVRRAGEVTATVVADGNPRLQAGAPGAARRACAAPSRATTRSPRPSTRSVPPATRPPSRPGHRPDPPPRPADQVTLGVVTDVADPEDRGRVRVRLPAYPGLTSPLGAGAARRPPAGTRAWSRCPTTTTPSSCSCPDATRRTPWCWAASTAALGPAERAGLGRPRRRTDAGCAPPTASRSSLDGVRHTIRLTDGHGSEVELAPDLLRITAATDLLIEAPGTRAAGAGPDGRLRGGDMRILVLPGRAALRPRRQGRQHRLPGVGADRRRPGAGRHRPGGPGDLDVPEHLHQHQAVQPHAQGDPRLLRPSSGSTATRCASTRSRASPTACPPSHYTVRDPGQQFVGADCMTAVRYRAVAFVLPDFDGAGAAGLAGRPARPAGHHHRRRLDPAGAAAAAVHPSR